MHQQPSVTGLPPWGPCRSKRSARSSQRSGVTGWISTSTSRAYSCSLGPGYADVLRAGTDNVVERLLESEEPSIRLKVRAAILGEDASAEEVRRSPRTRALLSERRADGMIPQHPYTKWTGAHWVLVMLAEIGYPPGDEQLLPLREQVYGWLLTDYHERRWVPPVDGLSRIHASQEGNAIWSLLTLGLADEGVERLVRRLLATQWPDGGWNCDLAATGKTSAFAESLIPLRALALHARITGSAESRDAAIRAAEVFLVRQLYRRRSDGQPTQPWHVELHFPCYFHYDFLFGLKVMNEAGFLGDERCEDALELLESKRLPDGGFPAEGRYYSHANASSRRSLVDWGGANRRRLNLWVTADALAVLAAANTQKV
jgi:hypothetical protein